MVDQHAELEPMVPDESNPSVDVRASPTPDQSRRRISLKYVVALLVLVGIVLAILAFDSFAVVKSEVRLQRSDRARWFETRLANTSVLVNDHGAPLRLAYMLYATNARTVCNAIILASNLRKLGTPTSIPIVALVGNDVAPDVIQRLTDANIVAIPVEPWKQESVEQSAEWFSSLTKLRIFEERGYDKVIYLDSDVWVHRNLDHLFLLGDAVMWAPHAYYLSPQYVFGSTLLVFSPSQAVFNQIRQAVANPPRPDYYDMDVLNDLYKLDCGFLPNNYVALTYTLVDDFTWSFQTKSERIAKTYVHHFSPGRGVGKPWNTPRSILDHRDPSFEPLFYDLFAMYWEHEDRLCAWLK